MTDNLISIIIPIYNRVDLFRATFDSIINQTHINWECIVVDDGSNDGTIDLLEEISRKDSRLKYFHRPLSSPKGANACRNFGFEKSSGQFIQYFDSDDIMTDDFLALKFDTITCNSCDYVITLTQNFLHPNILDKQPLNDVYYNFDNHEITHQNYCEQKVNWLTPDLFVKRQLAKILRFNVKLPSGQEYNYNCKLTALSVNYCLVRKVVTYRRLHQNSIKARFNNKLKYLKDRSKILFENWQDLISLETDVTEKSQDYFFKQSIELSLNNKIEYSLNQFKTLSLELNYRLGSYPTLLYLVYQIISRTLNRGHFVRKQFLTKWKRNS